MQNEQVHQTASGMMPVFLEDNFAVMSIGFLLESPDDAIIWRGPKKNGRRRSASASRRERSIHLGAGLIKQFLRDVDWGELDFLVIDTPPGTSDEHLSIEQYLRATHPEGAVIITTPQVLLLLFLIFNSLSNNVCRRWPWQMCAKKSTFARRWACPCWESSRT